VVPTETVIDAGGRPRGRRVGRRIPLQPKRRAGRPPVLGNPVAVRILVGRRDKLGLAARGDNLRRRISWTSGGTFSGDGAGAFGNPDTSVVVGYVRGALGDNHGAARRYRRRPLPSGQRVGVTEYHLHLHGSGSTSSLANPVQYDSRGATIKTPVWLSSGTTTAFHT